jgi:putative FmdB family regulatory protein
MPTYEYECNGCGYRGDIFQSISEKPKRKCPSCKGLTLKRLIGSGGGIIFKGSGFYETDYRSKSYQEGKRKETSAVDSAKKESDTSSAKTSSVSKKKKDKKMKAAG